MSRAVCVRARDFRSTAVCSVVCFACAECVAGQDLKGCASGVPRSRSTVVRCGLQTYAL